MNRKLNLWIVTTFVATALPLGGDFFTSNTANAQQEPVCGAFFDVCPPPATR